MATWFKKWGVIVYLTAIWLVFKIIAFFFGYTPYPDITQLALLGQTYPFITALGFGLWIGAAARDSFKLTSTVTVALAVSFIVGLVVTVLTLTLASTSPTFVSYAIAVYPARTGVGSPFFNLAISTWFGGICVTVPAAAAAYMMLDRRKKAV